MRSKVISCCFAHSLHICHLSEYAVWALHFVQMSFSNALLSLIQPADAICTPLISVSPFSHPHCTCLCAYSLCLIQGSLCFISSTSKHVSTLETTCSTPWLLEFSPREHIASEAPESSICWSVIPSAFPVYRISIKPHLWHCLNSNSAVFYFRSTFQHPEHLLDYYLSPLWESKLLRCRTLYTFGSLKYSQSSMLLLGCSIRERGGQERAGGCDLTTWFLGIPPAPSISDKPY